MKQNPAPGAPIGFQEVLLSDLQAANVSGHVGTRPLMVGGATVWNGVGPVGDYLFWHHPEGLCVSHPSWWTDVDVTEEYGPPTFIEDEDGRRTVEWSKPLGVLDYVRQAIGSDDPRVFRRWTAPEFVEL